MLLFHAIAAMSENRVIGSRGGIPWHLPDDFRWFKHQTMGGTLVMGRKTFESIGRPLPGRKTLVLTRGPVSFPGVETCPDAARLPAGEGTFWICGGAEIYSQLLPRCERLYLTRVKREMDGDAFMPVFEHRFRLDQLIHETAEFRVERWLNEERFADRPSPTPEAWPFGS